MDLLRHGVDSQDKYKFKPPAGVDMSACLNLRFGGILLM